MGVIMHVSAKHTNDNAIVIRLATRDKTNKNANASVIRLATSNETTDARVDVFYT